MRPFGAMWAGDHLAGECLVDGDSDGCRIVRVQNDPVGFAEALDRLDRQRIPEHDEELAAADVQPPGAQGMHSRR